MRTRGQRIWMPVLIVVAVLAAAALPTGIVLLARGSDDDVAAAYRHSSNTRPVMPGHGLVMPSDVHAMARAGELVVDVGDYWFKPSSRSLRAGRYRLAVHNYGVIQHDVMVERTPIKFSAPGQPVDEAAPYGVDGLMPGMRKSASMVLGPGRWEIFCSVGGHYMSGQHVVINVSGHLAPGMSERMSGMGDDEDGGMGTMDRTAM